MQNFDHLVKNGKLVWKSKKTFWDFWWKPLLKINSQFFGNISWSSAFFLKASTLQDNTSSLQQLFVFREGERGVSAFPPVDVTILSICDSDWYLYKNDASLIDGSKSHQKTLSLRPHLIFGLNIFLRLLKRQRKFITL